MISALVKVTIGFMVVIALFFLIAIFWAGSRDDYLFRSHVIMSMADTNAVAINGKGIKEVVADYYKQHGRFPDAGYDSLFALGLPRREYNALQSIGSDGSNALVLELRRDLSAGDSGESPVAGKTLLLTYDRDKDTWGCSAGGEVPIAAKYLPDVCR